MKSSIACTRQKKSIGSTGKLAAFSKLCTDFLKIIFLLATIASSNAHAMSYVPMTDDDLLAGSDLVVSGAIIASDNSNDQSSNFHSTKFRIDQFLKGSLSTKDIVIDVPGNNDRLSNFNYVVPGAPHFSLSERAVLFLKHLHEDHYAVSQLALGAFHVVNDSSGQSSVYRDLSEAHALNVTSSNAVTNNDTQLRDLDLFCQWILQRSSGRTSSIHYWKSSSAYPSSTAPTPPSSSSAVVSPDNSTNPTARWFDFDQGRTVTFYASSTGQNSLPGGGFAEFQVALSVYDKNQSSNIKYVYGGTTAANGGMSRADGVNEILFNDPNNDIPGSFDCQKGGVVAVGGYRTLGNLLYKNASFGVIQESDIVVQDGAGCVLAGLNNSNAAEVFTHELGHTLGLFHSCGDAGKNACIPGSQEDAAIMRSYIHADGRGAVLGFNDVSVLSQVYGNGVFSASSNSASGGSWDVSTLLVLFLSGFRNKFNGLIASLAMFFKRLLGDRYREAFNNSSICMAHLDTCGMFIDANERFCALTGYASADLSSMSIFDITHSDDAADVGNSFKTLLASKDSCISLTKRIVSRDGSVFAVNIMATLVRDMRGGPSFIVSTLLDVTHNVGIDQQLHRSQRLESLGQLTGGVAHDFNNILTVILGCTQILTKRLESTPSLHELAQISLKAAERGADLTNRLLTFARKQVLQPKPTDINTHITGMHSLLRRTLPENISIEIDLKESLLTALIDPSEFEDALLNLCLNSRDAMPSGGRLIIKTENVRLEKEYTSQYPGLDVGMYTTVTVSDSGSGISKQNIDKVFDPFFTTKDVSKGTGLGLSMVYGFVQQSKGHITIYSELGIGTTVKMYFPTIIQAANHAEDATSASSGINGNESILLVEDDELVSRYASSQLSDLGYRVIIAKSGKDAINIIRDNKNIDLLFTDIVMPGGINGFVLAQQARVILPDIKVLFTSGYTDETLIDDNNLLKGARLLNKPYQHSDLAKSVRSTLDISYS